MSPAPELAVETTGLVKHFGDTRAVDGVDLAVRAGTVYGVLGPNGAGKTTAVRMLATLLTPTAGLDHIRKSTAPLGKPARNAYEVTRAGLPSESLHIAALNGGLTCKYTRGWSGCSPWSSPSAASHSV